MGSGVSKPTNVDASSSSSRSVRKGKCKGSSRVFQSSCLGGASSDDNINICDHDSSDDGSNTSAICWTETRSSWVRTGHRKVKLEQSDEGHLSSNIELDKCSGENVVNAASRSGSIPSLAASTSSLTSRSGFLSRFSFIPRSVSFRLNRASSLGSSRAYRIPSSSGQMFDGEEVRPQSRLTSGIADGSETGQISDLLPVIRSQHSADAAANSQHYDQSSVILDINEGDQTVTSVHDAGSRRNRGCTKVENDGTSRSPRIYSDSDSLETRISDRRIGTQEPIEHNVCFSRTLSVGRLRDRVLRRSPSNTTFCPMQQERELRDAIHARRRPALVGETRISESVGDGFNPPTTSDHPPSGTSSSLFGAHDREPETTRSRDTRYHDLLEHRSNFLERRRRIRSQVRALQRLGSRFENLSGHDRSCILSGHHRTGHCTCRTTNRDANLNDDTSARASISRIVMLAEALFEVLDEIHQQSVVLSSQPSLSSLGSVPAPNEVVESLPVELYTKFHKHQNEEAAQCYICLVEYEEGDSVRILPCHHEFHRTCIDKWLKEIHRVCPLCRGDVCRSESVAAEH